MPRHQGHNRKSGVIISNQTPTVSEDSVDVAVCFDEILASNTGHQTPTQLWAVNQARQRELKRQTKSIAETLEANGYAAVRPGVGISMLSEVTGILETLENFRAIRFLPTVAQRDRAPLLSALRYFVMSEPKGKYIRYAVITTGARLPIGYPLRTVIQKLHRQISKWSSEAMARFGVEVLYRGTEFTIDDSLSIHPHANVLYVPNRKLSKDHWRRFLTWTHTTLKAHWRDCGKLVNPDEAVKYPFKPNDVNCLSGRELVWLAKELERLKLAQPMGTFAAFWRALEHNHEKVRVLVRNGKPRLTKVKKLSRPKIEATAITQIRENIPLSRIAPMPKHTPYWEPHTLVFNFTLAPSTGEGVRNLRLLRERQVQATKLWDRNGAPAPAEALAEALNAKQRQDCEPF